MPVAVRMRRTRSCPDPLGLWRQHGAQAHGFHASINSGSHVFCHLAVATPQNGTEDGWPWRVFCAPCPCFLGMAFALGARLNALAHTPYGMCIAFTAGAWALALAGAPSGSSGRRKWARMSARRRLGRLRGASGFTRAAGLRWGPCAPRAAPGSNQTARQYPPRTRRTADSPPG